MAKKKRKHLKHKAHQNEAPNGSVEVNLKPFLGIPPGVYLTILYGLIILLILFMLLFYKGLREQGVYLKVSTFPSGAAVRVDDRYVGSSPCEVLVPKGPRRLTVSKPYYKSEIFEDSFRGPVFATLFFRPRQTLDLDLVLEDAQGLVNHALEDFAANNHIPEILIETVRAGYRASADTHEQLYYFLDKSKYFITNSMQLHTYLYALTLLDANVQVLTPSSLLQTAQNIIQVNQKYENFPFWLTLVLQEETAQQVIGTDWFSGFLSRYRAHLEETRERGGLSASRQRSGTPIRIRGLSFYPVPAGELLQGGMEEGTLGVHIPHPVIVERFYMSETEVANRVYLQFLKENPEWDVQNLDELVRGGLVDTDYLAALQEDPGQEDLPVTGVSFHAAQAFCSWLTDKTSSEMPEYVARLPFESEWEWAARGGLVGMNYPLGSQAAGDHFFSRGVEGPKAAGSSPANAYGLRDMSGNVWEWCQDWYSPVKYTFTSWKAENNGYDSSSAVPIGAEKVIRGGSWANEKELVKVSTRASQPPEWCTPYLGFRVVLARRAP